MTNAQARYLGGARGCTAPPLTKNGGACTPLILRTCMLGSKKLLFYALCGNFIANEHWWVLESIKPTGQDADYGNSTVRKSIIYIFGSNSH